MLPKWAGAYLLSGPGALANWITGLYMFFPKALNALDN